MTDVSSWRGMFEPEYWDASVFRSFILMWSSVLMPAAHDKRKEHTVRKTVGGVDAMGMIFCSFKVSDLIL